MTVSSKQTQSYGETLKAQLRPHLGSSVDSWNWFDDLGSLCVQLSCQEVLPFFSSIQKSRAFDMIMNLTAVDYPKRSQRFEVVYELFHSQKAQRLRVKVPVKENGEICSLTSLWKGVDWFEREVYDMFGIHFQGHKNMRRILTHHEFVGHPLRKDYPADKQQPCHTALPIHFDNPMPGQSLPEKEGGDEDLVPLNIGPSHPATHGTLRIMAQLKGEKIKKANVELGYLHRCFEKMAETHPYNQVIPIRTALTIALLP